MGLVLFLVLLAAPDLSFLAGRWTGEQDGLLMEEYWSEPAGPAIVGLHRDVRGGRLVSWEFFRIDTTPEGTFYYASPRSAAPVAFELVEHGEARLVFENRAHDFPQRILYWKDANGALHARIEGPREGRTVGQEWTWRKTP